MKRPSSAVPGRPIVNRRVRTVEEPLKRSSPQRQDPIAGCLSSSDSAILMGLAQAAFSSTMSKLYATGELGRMPISTAYPSRTIDLLAQACVNFFCMPAAARRRREPKVMALAEALAAIKAGTPSVDDGLLGELVFDSLTKVDYINAWGF